MRCPSGHDNRPDATFCLECGAGLVIACAACSRELPRAARFCDGCGAPVADAALPTPAGHREAPASGVPPDRVRERGSMQGEERRNVTVLFVDAVGSTPVGEKLDPEELHRIVQSATAKMIEAVNRFDGTVAQFRGDGIMAIFGAPIAHEDSARRAVASALAMRDSLIAHAEEVRRGGKQAFVYRIGLNTGPVIVGSIGNDFSMDYTAIGDTVNLGARMEQTASENGIRITEHTARHVSPYFELADLGAIDVKGKAQPVHCYEVVRELPARTRLEASAERGLTPYVGRDEQLDALRAHFERARRGQGQVVFISGEPGIGKSRLLYQFALTLEGEARWLGGRCISWGGTFPYLPIVGVLRSAFGLDEGDDDTTILSRIAEGVRGWKSDAAEAAAPHLKYLLNVGPGDQVRSIDPSERRERVLDALKALLMQESRTLPLVVAVEDLHWIDEQSEEALAAIVDAVASLPVMVLLTYRPGYMHALGDRSYYGRLSLLNLPPDDSAHMVGGVLQSAGIPLDLCRMIVDKAEGNPFFIEEVSRGLVESGILVRSSDSYLLARPVDEVTIPDTIQEVILSRIDRLERRAKEAVQYASVIGREFPVRLLKHIVEAEQGIDDLLAGLKSLELIYEKSYFPELEYMFKHALTQEVALSTLLGDRRKALHRAVAAGIEHLYGDRLAEQYEALAYHYYEGEEWEKACDYAKLVAARARDLHAPRAVIEQVTRAIDAAMRCDPECCNEMLDPSLYALRGAAYEATGDFERSRADYESAMDKARQQGDVPAEWRAHADLGMLWAGRDYAVTGEHYRTAYDLATASGDAALIGRSLNRLGNWCVNVMRPAEAAQYHDEALRIFRGLDDKRGIAETLDFFTMAVALGGDLQRSLDLGTEAAVLFRELDDRQALSGLLATLSFCSGNNMQTSALVNARMTTADALAYSLESLRIAESIGSKPGESYALMHRSMQMCSLGEYGDGLREGRRGLETAEAIGHMQWQASGHATLGLLYWDMLSHDRALAELSAGRALAQSIGSLHWSMQLGGVLATVLAETGRIDEANAVLAEDLRRDTPAVTIAQRALWLGRTAVDLAAGDANGALRTVDLLVVNTKNTGGRGAAAVPRLAHERGRALLALGRIDAAERDLTAALEGAVAEAARPLQWRVLETLGELRLKQQRDTDARECFTRALAVVEECAATIDEGDLRRAFLGHERIEALRSAARSTAAL